MADEDHTQAKISALSQAFIITEEELERAREAESAAFLAHQEAMARRFRLAETLNVMDRMIEKLKADQVREGEEYRAAQDKPNGGAPSALF